MQEIGSEEGGYNGDPPRDDAQRSPASQETSASNSASAGEPTLRVCACRQNVGGRAPSFGPAFHKGISRELVAWPMYAKRSGNGHDWSVPLVVLVVLVHRPLKGTLV